MREESVLQEHLFFLDKIVIPLLSITHEDAMIAHEALQLVKGLEG